MISMYELDKGDAEELFRTDRKLSGLLGKSVQRLVPDHSHVLTLETMPLRMIGIANLPDLRNEALFELYARDDILERVELYRALRAEIGNRGLYIKALEYMHAKAGRLEGERRWEKAEIERQNEAARRPSLSEQITKSARAAVACPPDLQALKLATRQKREAAYKEERERPMRIRRAEQEAALGVALATPVFDRRVMLGTVRS